MPRVIQDSELNKDISYGAHTLELKEKHFVRK